MRRTIRRIIPTILLTLSAGTCPAENWPQWRGPHFNGTTTEKNLPATLAKENLAWSAPMPGTGSATPIVWGERVFVSSVDANTGDLLTLCLSIADGKLLWRKEMGRNYMAFMNDMASPSACTDGNFVFFHFGTGDWAGFDMNGKELWRRNIQKESGNLSIKFGHSSSPLLYQGKLYLQVLRRPKVYRDPPATGPLDSFLLCVDARTGKDLWKHVRATDAQEEAFESYATAIPDEADGRRQIIVTGGDYLSGHEPDTGKELWRFGYNPRKERWWRLVPTPAVYDGLVFASTPRKAGPGFAVKLGGTGNLGQEHRAWVTDEIAPDVCCPVPYQGNLYWLDGDKKLMYCRDPKTGKIKWQGSVAAEGDTSVAPGFNVRVTPGGDPVFRASPTASDGKLYCVGERGEIVILAAGDEHKVLSRLNVGEGPCRASISISAGRLFMRTAKNLHCFAGKGR